MKTLEFTQKMYLASFSCYWEMQNMHVHNEIDEGTVSIQKANHRNPDTPSKATIEILSDIDVSAWVILQPVVCEGLFADIKRWDVSGWIATPWHLCKQKQRGLFVVVILPALSDLDFVCTTGITFSK